MHLLPSVMLIVLALGALTGCPPPPLELDEPDAAPNAPPAITSVRNETGIEFEVGIQPNPILITGPEAPSPSLMRLTLVDPDVADTLYARGFFDYDADAALPARAVCNVTPGAEPTATRSLTCSLRSLCNPGDVATNPHRLDVLVFDRAPDDAGVLVPPYYSVDPASGGLPPATRSYRIECQDPV